MRTTPRIAVGSTWHQINPPWIAVGSTWRQCAQVWVASGDTWRPTFDFIDLPASPNGWINTSGRNGSIPGVIWGSTKGYNYWNLKTVKTVVGIQIQIDLNKAEGSYHGSGGQFVANQTATASQWQAGAHDGVQTSPVLACSFAAGEQIKVWCYGNSDNGDGKLFNSISLVNVIYG